MYIYISIYNQGPISRSQGSKTANPPESFQRKKLLLMVTCFGSILEVLPREPEKSFWVRFGGFWDLIL